MQYAIIDDPADARVADYVDLTDPQIRRRQESNRFFIAEGIEVVKRMIGSDIRCRSIVVAPNRLEMMGDVLSRADCPVYVADRNVLSRIVGFDLHRGVIASGQRPDAVSLEKIFAQQPLLGEHHRVAVLHEVSDHENLGAIVRSARAFHIDALVLDPSCADPYYRRCVRVSMGEIFRLPVVQMPVQDLIHEVCHRGGSSVAFTPRPDAVRLDDLLPVSGPLALIFGSEGFGLPDDVLQLADVCSRIPIASDVDSLNVGHAAAVAFARTARL